MSTSLPIELPYDKIVEFCQRHHICKLSLFGSVLRDDFGPDSDIDFLVEFEPKSVVGFLGLAKMELELSKILNRKADLRTPAELSSHFRQKILDMDKVLYEYERLDPIYSHVGSR
jgi:predicted nucleotidyltransferase